MTNALLSNNKFLFLGGLLFDNIRSEVQTNSKVGLQFAADTFQSAMISGMAKTFNSLDVITLPFIGAYPINYQKLYSPKSHSSSFLVENKKVNVRVAQFNNLIFFKLFFREHIAYGELDQYCKTNSSAHSIFVFIYSVHIPFLKAAIRAKKKYRNLKIINIVPDLPEFKNDKQSRFKTILNNYDTHVSDSIYRQVDGYILLSEFMKEKLPIHDKPSIVIEGIFNNTGFKNLVPERDDNKKIVLYSGTLARRYDIMNLVNAFRLIQDSNIELHICGKGNCEEEIKSISSIDKRIKLLGALPHEDVVERQKKATLLVNPRTDSEEYTRYSFPSKTMEYLASGTPTLIYKLPAIPEEYYNHCFWLTGNSVTDLSAKICDILSKPSEELQSIGRQAQNFILTNKSAESQCNKILGLLSKI